MPVVPAIAVCVAAGTGVVTLVGAGFVVKNAVTSRNIPERVEDFERIKKIGHGAFGEVYAWQHKKTRKKVACKEVELGKLVPLRGDADESQAVKALRGEIDLLQRVKHDNIVEFMDFCQKDNKLYMFMELLELSLTDLVKRRIIQEDEARLYTRGILDGLIYLHSQAVIHCDIKGNNVLLKQNKVAKLCDFGISRHYSDGQSILPTEHLTGTLPYMAPEILENKKHGKRSDVWAVGCTVYEMLHRKPPFHELVALVTIKTMGFEQKDLVKRSRVLNDKEKDFLLQIFVEKEKRPFPENLRAHAWLQ